MLARFALRRCSRHLSARAGPQLQRGCSRVGSSALIPTHGQPVCVRGLILSAATIKHWEKISEERSDSTNLESLCNTMISNLEQCRYARSSNMNKIFDLVTTQEDLELAEKVLVSFRHSLCWPRLGLPLVVIRACLRVGSAQKVLAFIRNKVRFGIFPSRRVYNILIDGLLNTDNPKGAVGAYEQLLKDEIRPDEVTYFLAAKSYALLGTPEDLEQALELCKQCRTMEPKLGTMAYASVVKALLKQQDTEKALELLGQLKETLPSQTLLNLRVHTLTAAGDYSTAISTLEEELSSPDMAVPPLAFPVLREAVEQSGEESQKLALQALITNLQSTGRLPQN